MIHIIVNVYSRPKPMYFVLISIFKRAGSLSVAIDTQLFQTAILFT